MPEITKVKTANREEWKELRSHYLGGSDAAAWQDQRQSLDQA